MNSEFFKKVLTFYINSGILIKQTVEAEIKTVYALYRESGKLRAG